MPKKYGPGKYDLLTGAIAASKWYNDLSKSSKALVPYKPGKDKKKPQKRRRMDVIELDNKGNVQTQNKDKKKRKPRRSVGLREEIKDFRKKLAKLKQPMATYTEYYNGYVQPSASSGVCAWSMVEWHSRSTIETVLSRVPVTSDTSPATTTALSFNSVAYGQSWNYKIYAELTLRNNYLFPADVIVYCVEPRNTTGLTPVAALAAYDNTEFISGGTYTEFSMKPSMYKGFNDLYKIVNHANARLLPGEELIVKANAAAAHNHKDDDVEALEYRRGRANFFLIRIAGVLAHESLTPATISSASAKLDGMYRTKYEITYPNIAPTHIKYVNNPWTTLTTPALALDSAEAETSL